MKTRQLAVAIILVFAVAGCRGRPAGQQPAPVPPAQQTQPAPQAEQPAPQPEAQPPSEQQPSATQPEAPQAEQPTPPQTTEPQAAPPSQPETAQTQPPAQEQPATAPTQPSAQPTAPAQPAPQAAAPGQPAPSSTPPQPAPTAQPVDLGPEVPLPYTADFTKSDALKVWKVYNEPDPSGAGFIYETRWQVRGGRLVYEQPNNVGHWEHVIRLDNGVKAYVLSEITVGSKEWKDYEIDFTIDGKPILGDGEFGILFGYQTPDRYYRIAFFGSELRLERRQGDRMAELARWYDFAHTTMPYSTQKSLPVRVAFAHGRIAVWLGAAQVMNFPETDHRTGKAGLFAAGMNRVEFTKFSVRPISDPKAVALQPVNLLSVEAGAGVIHYNFVDKGAPPTAFMDKVLEPNPWSIDAKKYAPPYETVFRFPKGWWARLDRFAIVKCNGRLPNLAAPRQVEVWASRVSPFEGFQKIADLTLNNKEGEESAPLRGAWARYLKVRLTSGHDPEAVCVAQLKAIGTLHQFPPDKPAPLRDELQETETNDTVDRANPLPLRKSLAGELPSDVDKDVFKVALTPGAADTLRLDVDPRSMGAPSLTLTDAAGKQVATVGPEKFVDRPTRLEWKLQPGDYYITVTRPPASLVMVYDDSHSIQGYLNVVRQLLLTNLDKLAGRVPIMLIRYAAEPDPLTPFTNDPAPIRTALEKGQGGGGGTDTIYGLKAAFDALRPRGGNRIILWVFDILDIKEPIRSRIEEYMIFHQQVAREPVRIYGLGTGCCPGYELYIGLTNPGEMAMELVERQGGKYFFAPTEREVKDIGQQILDDLAGPLKYALRADVVKGAPEMGEIRVDFVPEAKAITRNLEIILDASGSMNSKLGSGTRFSVAKQVLTDLVKQLPPDINVSLRVFGHRKGGPASCQDSELLIPPAPLNAAGVIAKVNALRARGETPLVANLLLAGSDLAKAKAGTVVAITDGEESCKGNVQTVAAQLKAQGVQLVVNIVGFNLPNAKSVADWKSVAQSTGGRFFDAKTAGDLSAALREAVKLEYVAYDQAGKEVGKARVGQPLRLPEGTYTIVVRAGQPVKVEGVKVSAKEPAGLVLRRQGTAWSLGPEKSK